MQPRVPLLALLLCCFAQIASAQTTLQMDQNDLSQGWSLTSPNAGPNDWIGVAYLPPLEFPFRVVSATMHYIDTFCCQTLAPACDATCNVFNDWERRVITGADFAADAAGLTPDLATPLVDQSPVGQSPQAFVTAGSTSTSFPWTLSPDVWTLGANTVFDRPGRLFYATKYFNGDQWMRFVADDTGLGQHPNHRAIFTNNGFATRSALWGFGNVGMRLSVEPVFFIKSGASQPASSVILANQAGVTMLSVRIQGGNSSTTLSTFEVDGSGSGNEANAVQSVRLVLDANANGTEDTGETVLATGTFAADNGRVALNPSRTLSPGTAEEWIVVYDFNSQPSGGDTFIASIGSPSRITSNLGAPFVSGTANGGGSIAGASVMIAGTLVISAGPAAPPARVVPAGATALPVLQLRLTSSNEAFDVSALTFGAQGSVNDLTEVPSVRLYNDTNANGQVDGGEALLGTGTFGADDGQLTLSFGSLTVSTNQSLDLLLVVDLAATAAGGDGFRALLASSADVTATGVASGALPGTGPRALTGAPIIGELVTVGGALTAQMGAAAPANGTAQPGATDVPMLQVTFSAQAEDVQLSTLTFDATGTGDEVLDITRARLFRDTNANGIVDAADVQAGLPQSFAADNGVLTFALSAEVVPTAGVRSYLLAYDFSGAPTGAETFIAHLTSATSITASGQASGAAVTAAGNFPLDARTVTLLGGLSMTVGAQSPAPARAQPGARDVPVVQVSVSGQGEVFTIAQLTLTAAGSLLDASAISAVRIYRDQGSSGVRDTPDVLLGTATYGLDDGQATFMFSPALTLNPGSAERWLVVYDLNNLATPGQTFRASVASAADILATGTLSGPTILSGLPVTGANHSIGGGLTVSAGPNNPSGGALALLGQSQAMLQVRLQADLEPITVDSFTINGGGSGNETTGVAAAYLYVDSNGDGTVDTVGDVLIAGPSTFAQNDGALTFTLGAPRTIAAASSEVWLVAYDLSGSIQAGETFQTQIMASTDIASRAPSGLLPGVSGAPVQGGARTVLGSLQVSTGPNTPSARTLPNNASGASLMQVRLTSTAETFSVGSLTVHAAGSMDDVADIAGATLIQDVDGSGDLSMGDNVLAGPLAFSGDDGRVTFGGLNLTVPTGTAVDLVVSIDLSGQANGGTGTRVLMRDATDIVVSGLQGRAVTPTGLPISSNTVTAGGTLQVGLGAGSTLGQVARRGDGQVPGMQLRFVSTTESVDLTQIILHGSGTGNDATGIANMELWLDANADGLVSPGESRVAVGSFGADDGQVTLGLSQTVQVGPALHLLATFTLSGTPIGAETFALALDPNQDLSFSSVSGAVIVGGTAVTGGLLTVGGGFTVAAGTNNPTGGLVNQAIQNLSVLQLNLSAVNERCTVQSLTLRAVGGIHDATDITDVRLVFDTDDSGTFTTGDTQIAGPVAYLDDDAELVFSSIYRSLNANISERWLAVYNLSGQASNLESFSARLEGPAQVQVRCQVSGPLTPTGTPAQGGSFTVQEDGALVLNRGQQSPPARFVAEGTVRAPVLQIRAAASVQPLTLNAMTLTANVSSGSAVDAVASVDLFLDVNQDGLLDRSDRLLVAGGAPDSAGQVAFTNLGLALPLNEAQFLLAAVNVAPDATPGTQFSLGIVSDSDATADSGFGPALTTGAPILSESMTVAGDLNVETGQAAMDSIVSNDARELVALDVVVSATWESFTIRRLTISAQGSMDPATGVQGLSLVVDEDGDGQVSAGDQPIASGLTFPEGANRTTFDTIGVAVPAGQSKRLLVLVDLSGTARVDQTLGLSLASDLDFVAEGDRRGLSSPVGAPIEGDTFTVGASLLFSLGDAPPADDVVTADAVGVPVLQLQIQAANEDVTLARLALSISGALNDATGIRAVHLYRDADGDGIVDPEDIELGAAARPAGDDGVINFAPLSERLARNDGGFLLVTVDLSGTGSAGQDFTLRLNSDADVTAFGARSGAVVAQGAPLDGAHISLVGTMNVRLGPASPAGRGIWPGTEFAGLQLELFTRGEDVTISALTLTVAGGMGTSAIENVRLIRDTDGDGLPSEGEPELGQAEVQGAELVFSGLAMTLAANTSARILAVVKLGDDAAPGESIRLAIAATEDISARGATSGDISVVGAPVLGSAFTVTKAPETTEMPQAEGGCSCNSSALPPSAGLPWVGLGLALVFLFQLVGLTKKES